MSSTSGESEYSIAAVSKLTGASCDALRVWERRYGFPTPHRAAAGHRDRYSREQIDALLRITRLAQTGRPIRELIAEYGKAELELVETAEASQLTGAEVEAITSRLVETLIAGEETDLEAAYQHLTEGLTPAEIVTRVIGPTWIDAGERWFRSEIAVYQERAVSEFLIRKLHVMIDAARLSNTEPAHTILLGTVRGRSPFRRCP